MARAEVSTSSGDASIPTRRSRSATDRGERAELFVTKPTALFIWRRRVSAPAACGTGSSPR